MAEQEVTLAATVERLQLGGREDRRGHEANRLFAGQYHTLRGFDRERIPAIREAEDIGAGRHHIHGERADAPAAGGRARTSVLHESALAQLRSEPVVVGERQRAADQIHILSGPDRWRRGVGHQQAGYGTADEHQLRTQGVAEVLGDDPEHGDIRVIGIHTARRSSSSDKASVRSRALPPRTASNSASISPSAGLRAAASGTLGYSG